jgi:hypothetical protein
VNTDTKGDPITGKVTTSVHRTVLVELSNCARADNGTGVTFVPDRLWMEWNNGELTQCALSGRRIRADGLEWLDGRRTHREYLRRYQRPFTLDADTPNWVKSLVYQHKP